MNIQIIYTESKDLENICDFYTWDADITQYVKETYKNTGKIIFENVVNNTVTIDNKQIIQRTVTRVFLNSQSLIEFNQDQKISNHRKLKNTYNLNNQISSLTEKNFIN